MIPKIIHQMARTGRLSWEESRLTDRLRRILPDWRYHLWTNEDQLRLVRDYFPQYAKRHAAIPFSVARCDIARYVVMHRFGGFYFDTDYKLLRPLDPVRAPACVLGDEGADPQKGSKDPGYLGLGNALMGSVPNFRFWPALLQHIFEFKQPHRLARSEDIIEATGPEAMSRFYMAHAKDYPDIVVYPKQTFFAEPIWMGTRSRAGPDSLGVHLYWASWRNKSRAIALRTAFRRKLNGVIG